MKAAVSAQGTSLNSPVDPRFGRAQKFLVVDTETNEFSVYDNKQNLHAVQGAGIQAARTVVDAGATVVLADNIGPKAFAALEASNVSVYAGASGTVADAVEQLKQGQLQLAAKANVEGHWA